MISRKIISRLASPSNPIALVLLLTFALASCEKEDEPIPAPSITSFNPVSGIAGTPVTIKGLNFDKQAANNVVKVNGTVAIVSSATETTLEINIPEGATTGRMTVTTNGQTATSATDFIIYTKLELTSFEPKEGKAGTAIHITGAGFSSVTSSNIVKIGGISATVVEATATTLTVEAPHSGVSGTIELKANTQSLTSPDSFEYLPEIESISSTETHANGRLTIKGSGFAAAVAGNQVSINNVPVTIEQASPNNLVIQIPDNASNGPIALTVNSHIAVGPSITLVKEAMGGGGTEFDTAFGVATDHQGNTYSVGSFQNSAKFGELEMSGANEEIFIVKYDNTGNEVWVKSAGGSDNDRAMSVRVDDGGNLFIVGYCSGSATFGSITTDPVGGGFIARLDANGEFQWVKVFPKLDLQINMIVDIALDATGNAFVTGTIGNNANIDGHMITVGGETNTLVAKLSASDGKVMWLKNFTGTTSNDGNAIDVGSDGSIYVGGGFFGTVNFETQTFNGSATDLDAFLVKMNASGDVVWATHYSGNGWNNIYDIVHDGNNEAIVTGYFGSELTVSGISVNAGGHENVFVSKISSGGTIAWTTVGQSPGAFANGRSLAIDANNNTYVTGYYEGTLTMDGKLLAGAVNDRNVFVEKLNSSGNVQWFRKGGTLDSDWAQGITLDLQGRVVVTGSFRNMDGLFGSTTLENKGGDDAFLWRIWQEE